MKKTLGEMILELLQKRAEHVGAAEEVVARAQEENRDLTDEEEKALADAEKAAADIDKRVKTLERAQALKAGQAELVRKGPKLGGDGDGDGDGDEEDEEEDDGDGDEVQLRGLDRDIERFGSVDPADRPTKGARSGGSDRKGGKVKFVRSTMSAPGLRRVSRGGELEQGELFGQFVRAIAVAGKGNAIGAYRFAKEDKMHPSVIRALASNAAGAGQEWVGQQFAADFIDLLTEAQVVRRAGPDVIQFPQGVGKLNIPRQTSGASADYIGEGQPIPYTQIGTGTMSLTPKKLGALTALNREVIRRTTPSIDRVVRDNLVRAAADRADIQFLRGVASAIRPAGLRNLAVAGNILTMTASPDLSKVTVDLDRMELVMRTKNVPGTRLAWFLHPRVLTYLKGLRDANGNFAFREDIQGGRLNGIRVFDTTAMPINLGGGANETEIILADMAQFLIADEIDLTVQISDEAAYIDGNGTMISAFSNDQTVIKVITSHDTNVRYAEAIVVLTGVTWGVGL